MERDNAFAAASLDAELRRSGLPARDRAFATELVYGTLRLRLMLEKALASVAPRGIDRLDSRTRAFLLVAAYQLHYTRVPAFAAVSEAVEAVRIVRGRDVAGFANGSLRQLSLLLQQTPPPPIALALRDATAPWLRRALERSIGEEATEAFLTAGPIPPAMNLRVRGATVTEEQRQQWMERIRTAAPGATVEAAPLAPAAIRLRGAGDPHGLPGHADGGWVIQEEGSQLIGLLLGARPGERVLDACAGRGNKSLLLAEQLAAGDGSELHVADVHPDKIERLVGELTRLDLPAPVAHALDWSVGSGEVPLDAFDRVLLDAPCSGIGTLRRRPDLQSRRKAADLPELQQTQLALLERVATTVKPGGRLLYAVCSILRDEAEWVQTSFLERHPEIQPAPFDSAIAATLFAPGATSGRLLPQVHGTDGYFVASFVRTH